MISWDEAKREANKVKHGIDLAMLERVFDAPMLTITDDRAAYGEQRLKSLCFFKAAVVVLIWTERDAGPHLISCRYGDKHETEKYFREFL